MERYISTTLLTETPKPKRKRSTRDEVAARRQWIFDYVQQHQPMTVRQVYYQAVVAGIVAKNEYGYAAVGADLILMRKTGVLPYEWIVDHTRWVRQPYTCVSLSDALRDTAMSYRKDLWHDADCHVSIWLEKNALAGVIEPITNHFDVALNVAVGYSSISFLRECAKDLADLTVPAFVYHLGDWDPSGLDAGRNIEATLREHAPDVALHFARLAVTPEQIEHWNLPTRPTKELDTRAAKFEGDSVELDAIAVDDLRNLVETAIRQHMPDARFDRLMAEQEEERQRLTAWAERFADDD